MSHDVDGRIDNESSSRHMPPDTSHAVPPKKSDDDHDLDLDLDHDHDHDLAADNENDANHDNREHCDGKECASLPPPLPPPTRLDQTRRIAIVRAHYEAKGYRVHSGLQFGCELVLYADDPSRVHSDFCVHVVSPCGGDDDDGDGEKEDGEEGRVDWRTVQTLVRSMPDLHKTLILAHVRRRTTIGGRRRKRKRDQECGSESERDKLGSTETTNNGLGASEGCSGEEKEPTGVCGEYEVVELAIATEHAPFRHKAAARRTVEVGSQVKSKGK